MSDSIILQISVRLADDNSLAVTVDKRSEDSIAFIKALKELAAVSRSLGLTEAAEINRKLYGFENREAEQR